ncbi:hypothetical protein B0H12DRAFT_1081933 [Mycena haematopus]|nr:hypothetical protein B0H12DRAFT_1081933 [Mycena haematopus]
MSSSPSQHFREFSQLPSDPVGTDVFFADPSAFNYDAAPPYRLDANDIHWHASRPFFPVIQEERASGDYQMSEEERNSLYFLRHPAIIRVLPFLRRPRRLQRISREYAVDLLDRAAPIFRTFVRAYPHLPHTPLQEGVIRALVLFVQRVSSRFPDTEAEGWRSIFMEHSLEYWTGREHMPPFFRFPWTVEFSASHPLVPFQLAELNHNALLNIRSPALERLLETLASPPRLLSSAEQDSTAQVLNRGIPCLLQLARELRERRVLPDFAHSVFNSTRSLIQGFPEGRRNRAWTLALPPYSENFSQSVFPRDFVFPSGPHDHQNRTPFPLWNSAATGISDPLLDCWDQYQLARPSPASPPPHPSAEPVSPPARTEGFSPLYIPSTPISSPPFMLSPVSPSTMETSALLHDDTLTEDQKLDALRSRVASRTPGPSADAGGESTLLSQTLEESHEDAPMLLAEDTPPATQAAPSPPRSSAVNPLANLVAYGPGERRSSRPKTKPPRYVLPGVTVPPHRAEVVVEAPKKRPRQASSRRSISRQATPKRASLRPSTPFPRKSRAPSNGESEVDIDAYVDVPTDEEPTPKRHKSGKKPAAPSSQDAEPRFPPTSRRGRGRSSRAPPYEPVVPLEPFNTPRLAEEILALMRQTEPTLFDVGCANCMLRNRECSHVSLGTLCPECHKGKLAACSHQFTVSEHLRTVNFLEQYTRLSDARMLHIFYSPF